MISAFFCFSYFKIIDILSIGVTLSSDIKNILNKKFMKQEVLFHNLFLFLVIKNVSFVIYNTNCLPKIKGNRELYYSFPYILGRISENRLLPNKL